MSDSESSESEDEITPLNDETETVRPPDGALPSSEDEAALPSHQNQVALRAQEQQVALPSSEDGAVLSSHQNQFALRSQEQQVALPSNQGQLAGPSESEVTIMGGNFKKINLGPQTNKNKQVNKAYNYSNAKIEHHHHYYGDAEGSQDKAEALIKDSKFEEAISILEVLPSSPRQQLLLTDCYSQLGKDSQLIERIETMQMLMERHPRSHADDVLNLGVKYLESQAYIKALTYLSCVSKLYKLDHTSDPDHAMYKICDCSGKCTLVIMDMVKKGGRMRELADNFGICVIIQILADYNRSIRNGDPDVKIKYECYCLNNIGLCYRFTKQYQKSIENFKLGIVTMKHHFGEKASSFFVFGMMIHNLGLVEFALGNYIETEKCFSESLKAKELAEDLPNEEKKKFTQQSIDSLKNVRKQLGKTSA